MIVTLYLILYFIYSLVGGLITGLRIMMGPQLYKSYYSPKKIPKSLRKLRYIKDLDLDCGSISIIPKWFGRLKTLETVDFSYNNIETIPTALCKIKGIR